MPHGRKRVGHAAAEIPICTDEVEGVALTAPSTCSSSSDASGCRRRIRGHSAFTFCSGGLSGSQGASGRETSAQKWMRTCSSSFSRSSCSLSTCLRVGTRSFSWALTSLLFYIYCFPGRGEVHTVYSISGKFPDDAFSLLRSLGIYGVLLVFHSLANYGPMNLWKTTYYNTTKLFFYACDHYNYIVSLWDIFMCIGVRRRLRHGRLDATMGS